MIYLDHNATTPIAPEVLEASCHPERSERSRFALTTESGNTCGRARGFC
jgi:cysteine sulfinate desulfinase/cysteine desulfurase-like protein